MLIKQNKGENIYGEMYTQRKERRMREYRFCKKTEKDTSQKDDKEKPYICMDTEKHK